VRVWIDITNSPHVLFFAPIIRRLEAQGHTVTLTARKYAQTEQLLSRYGLAAVITGQHAGKSLPAKAVGLFNRSAHLIAQARSAGFHVAVGHNSNDLAVAAWTLGIPQLTMFDYEYATVSHHLNVRLVDEIVPNSKLETKVAERARELGIAPLAVRVAVSTDTTMAWFVN